MASTRSIGSVPARSLSLTSDTVFDRVRADRRLLLGLLAFALVVRLALVWMAAGVGTKIVDEQHYAELAGNLTRGAGFSWNVAGPTSIRPPLFPAFVAGVWLVAGIDNLTAVRLAQIPLSLLLIVVIYQLGRRVFNSRVGLMAALAVALYPSLLFSGVLILSETLFTLLLALTLLACVYLLDRPSAALAAITGMTLGAAALTRSVMWPFVPVLTIGLLALLPGRLTRRALIAACLAGGALVVIGPWSLRNTRLQGTFTVVDTMGGLNLWMGNYEHTPDDRMWDAISLTGDQSWFHDMPQRAPDGSRWTEATKEAWAKRQALAYMTSHPGQTAKRALLKFADFWGIERDFIAGVNQGLYAPPRPVVVIAVVAIAAAYCATLLLAWLGVVMVAPPWRTHVLLLGVVVFVCGIHTVVFGHPRYHLPLIPILLLYAAAAVDARAWRNVAWRAPAGIAVIAGSFALSGIWAHEVLWRDADKLQHVVRLLGWVQ